VSDPGRLFAAPPEPAGETEPPASTGGQAPASAWRGPSVRRWTLFAAIALTVVALDRGTKAWILENLEIGERIQVIGDLVRLVHWRNTGALFGLLPDTAAVFAAVSFVVVGLIVWYHRVAGRGILVTIALALLLGGAIGNLIDRVTLGSVVDFVDIGIGSLRFYTFNVADAAITTAIVMLIGLALLPKLGEVGTSG
jgi:signal peptidase II